MNQTDKIFYVMGWVLLGGLAILAILQGTGLLILTDFGFPCSFRQASGYYCPGCGGTHAVCSLASGHLLESFQNHAFVPYTALGFTAFLFWNTLASLLKTKEGSWELPFWHFHTAYVYIGIAIIFLQWGIKNLILIII